MIFLLTAMTLHGQSTKLANQYFADGEYEKAAVLYKKLMSNNKGSSDYFFSRYLNCLISLDDFEQAKAIVRSEIKKGPKSAHYRVHLGNIFEKEGDIDAANAQYEKAIDGLVANQMIVNRLATTFTQLNKVELAIRAYEKGEALNKKGNDLFAYQMADLYRKQGNQSKMIEYYLRSMKSKRLDVQGVQRLLSRYIEKDEFGELQTQLYIQIQDNPDDLEYLELLEWAFIQQGDYDSALRQAKAIDRRSNAQGMRVFNLATVAGNAADYEAAAKAYDYVINVVGVQSPYYFDAQKETLAVKRKKIITGRSFSEEELVELRSGYADFVEQVGKNGQSADVMAQWAELEALYLNNVEGAIDILNDIVKIGSINRFVLNNAKLDLGDYYLIKGEIWEATLLYSQVDKEFREDYLGEIARYKNARLSYFNGDFAWAQAQFDILKAATSRLISNDAIDQSVFIMDNLGLDTTLIPLQMYANAELLAFQNKYEAAFIKMDSIPMLYPGHKLEDDIWYLKAKTFVKQKRFDEAIELYTMVFTRYPEDIRADNSLFELADVYQYNLKDEAKAMELYETIFTEYSGSTLAVEARKQFRRLRGDLIQ